MRSRVLHCEHCTSTAHTMGVSFLDVVAGILVLFSSLSSVASVQKVDYPVCKPQTSNQYCHGEQDGSIFCDLELLPKSNEKIAMRSLPALSINYYESHTQLDDYAFSYRYNLSEGTFILVLRVCTPKGSSFAGPHGLKTDDLPMRENAYHCRGVGQKTYCWLKLYPWSPSLFQSITKYDPDWYGCLRIEGAVNCYVNNQVFPAKKKLLPSEEQLVSDYKVVDSDEHPKNPSGPVPLKPLVVTLQRPPGLSGASYN